MTNQAERLVDLLDLLDLEQIEVTICSFRSCRVSVVQEGLFRPLRSQ